MGAYHWPLLGVLLAGLIMPALAAVPVSAEPVTAEVLVIRPEYLPFEALNDAKATTRGRNPFVWGDAQADRIARLAESSAVDPFMNLKLSGIIWTSNDPVVIINKRQLRAGETIDGVTVREITKDAVVLAAREARRTMRFPDPVVLLAKPAEGKK
jgi:hypothetical protein